MAKRAFEQMMAGVEDAIAYANGDASQGRIAVPSQGLDAAAIRKRTGKTQG